MSDSSRKFIINVPTPEEMDAFRKERADDRRRRSAQNLFNPTNLGHWIDLCRTADVPHVPALEVARAPTDDLLAYETPSETAKAFWMEVEQFMKGRGPNWMIRWSCCSCAVVKYRLSEGMSEWDQSLVDEFMIADLRAFDIINEFPEETIAAYARPWEKARIVENYPVEYRVFVDHNELVGISNYYPQRALLNDKNTLADVAACYEFTERLIDAQTKPLNCPQMEQFWDVNQNHWTADFIRSDGGQILFLEGGPPYTPNGGAHPCCFMGRTPSGIALEVTADGCKEMGL
jgi:hypothetical protein